MIIEIPMNADPIKYEVDKESGAMFVDRFMSTAMHYPCNYGYVPQTLSDDGDPVDVLVITPFPLAPGVVVTCRPIGMLKMEDEAGGDAKLLAVPIDKILPHLHALAEARGHERPAPEADPALLRALQGSRARQVGEDQRLGQARRRRATRCATASPATSPARRRGLSARRRAARQRRGDFAVDDAGALNGRRSFSSSR